MKRVTRIFMALALMFLVFVLTLAISLVFQAVEMDSAVGKVIFLQTRLPLPGMPRCANYSTENHQGPLGVVQNPTNYQWQGRLHAAGSSEGISYHYNSEDNSLVLWDMLVRTYISGDRYHTERESIKVFGELSLKELPVNLIVYLDGRIRILKFNICTLPPSADTAMNAQEAPYLLS